MASKREGSPLVKKEIKRPFIKPEPGEDSKFSLAAIPAAPQPEFKQELDDRKPNNKELDQQLQVRQPSPCCYLAGLAGILPEPRQLSSVAAFSAIQTNFRRVRQSRRRHGPPCIRVDVGDGVIVRAHYDRNISQVKVKFPHPNGRQLDIHITEEFCHKITAKLEDCFIRVQPLDNLLECHFNNVGLS